MPLTSSVADRFRGAAPSTARNRRLIGVELEYENARTRQLSLIESGYWSVKDDGSLRNSGIEIVSRPLEDNDRDPAFLAADRSIARTNLDPSTRCGLHVHLNMLNMTHAELFSFITQYALIEPTLFHVYAPLRERSAFCVPLYDQPQGYMNVYKDVQNSRGVPYQQGYGTCSRGGTSPLYFMAHSSKYSALNLRCLQTFGTVEFRQHPSTRDFAEIRRWTDTITRIQESIVGQTDPLDTLSKFELKGLENLQRELIGYTVRINPKKQDKALEAATYCAGYAESSDEPQDDWLLPEEDEQHDEEMHYEAMEDDSFQIRAQSAEEWQ